MCVCVRDPFKQAVILKGEDIRFLHASTSVFRVQALRVKGLGFRV